MKFRTFSKQLWLSMNKLINFKILFKNVKQKLISKVKDIRIYHKNIKDLNRLKRRKVYNNQMRISKHKSDIYRIKLQCLKNRFLWKMNSCSQLFKTYLEFNKNKLLLRNLIRILIKEDLLSGSQQWL